jgi:hypothetical protein
MRRDRAVLRKPPSPPTGRSRASAAAPSARRKVLIRQ